MSSFVRKNYARDWQDQHKYISPLPVQNTIAQSVSYRSNLNESSDILKPKDPRLAYARAKAEAERYGIRLPQDTEQLGARPERVSKSRSYDDEAPFLRKTLIVTIIILLLIITGELVFQLLIAPQMMVGTFLFDLDGTLDKNELSQYLGLDSELRYYGLDTLGLSQLLLKRPEIREARVERVFPDTLKIYARERSPLLVTRVGAAEGAADSQKAVFLDSEGYAFAWVDAQYGSQKNTLPVLSGIDYRNFKLGLSLPDYLKGFLLDLAQLQKDNPDLYQAFSEFRLVPIDQERFEVLVYTMLSEIPVRINERLSSENALYILRTMNLLVEHPLDGKIRELDFRTQNLIIRRGEQ